MISLLPALTMAIVAAFGVDVTRRAQSAAGRVVGVALIVGGALGALVFLGAGFLGSMIANQFR